MNGRNRPASSVRKKDWDAIGNPYADGNRWVVGDGNIRLGPAIPIRLVCFEHIGAVHLAHADE